MSTMEEQLIAPCGMNCALCTSYLAGKYELAKTGIRKRTCPGCRPRGKNCTFMRKTCDQITKGKLQFCYECTIFPCRRLRDLDKRYRARYHMSMLDNLAMIQENGMMAFLENEQGKWRCPSCGATICCHDGICYSCQPDDITNQERKKRWFDESRA